MLTNLFVIKQGNTGTGSRTTQGRGDRAMLSRVRVKVGQGEVMREEGVS